MACYRLLTELGKPRCPSSDVENRHENTLSERSFAILAITSNFTMLPSHRTIADVVMNGALPLQTKNGGANL